MVLIAICQPLTECRYRNGAAGDRSRESRRIIRQWRKYTGMWCVTGEKTLFTFTAAEDRTCDPPHAKPTLYHVTVLYCKSVQVCLMPNTTTYSPSFFRFVLNLSLSNHSVPGHWAHRTGLFTLGARNNSENMLFTFAPVEDGTCDPSHVANTLPCHHKSWLVYRKAVQVCYLPNITTLSCNAFIFKVQKQANNGI